MLLRLLAILWMLSMVAAADAQDLAAPDAPDSGNAARADHQDSRQETWPHPELSSNGSWAKEMVLVILLGLFLPAAIIGPWVRKHVAAELPELHDQEEQSGLTASQHEPGHTKPVD